ncbi:MAG: cobalamin B12-binding domain-containing protein [Deltaproteobacteria bacterium]|nr:cobalamin B12-binding domain-containing protein [Deltaproteobacteria bacterium]
MAERLNKKLRVLIAKPGLDGHNRGALTVAKFLADKGSEVIYSGLNQTPEMIVNTAIQEDVDAIGLSILSGAHMLYFKRIRKLLRDHKTNILLFGGGIIPKNDKKELEEMGIQTFTPGTALEDIWSYLIDNC